VTRAALASNEELFRNVNERIENLSTPVAQDDEGMEFLCECDRAGCYEKVRVTRAEYESVRETPTHFIVLPGHEDLRIEHIAHSTERFVVVEKEGEAARDAVETDPRSND
jgi:hypothetical protein